MTFQIGDTVYLKSGGPEMTVESIWSDNSVKCKWSTPDGHYTSGSFVPETLISAEPEGPPDMFTDTVLLDSQHDLKSSRAEVERIRLRDDKTPGLSAIVRKDSISFTVGYHAPNSTEYHVFPFGEYPEMSIETARELAVKIRALAAKGIDPQKELMMRVIAELANA